MSTILSELGRTIMTLSCTDCDRLPKVDGAGRIIDSPQGPVQIMHNGLQVVSGGYYGDWMAQIIRGLRGHHEPQEELIFAHLLRYVRHNTLIAELGAFWAYYSAWYLHEVPGTRAICIEPDPNNIEVGKRNIALNGFEDRATFHEGWVGAGAGETFTAMCESTGEERTLPDFGLPAVLEKAGGAPIEMLHVDAQGAETALLSTLGSIDSSRLRFVVISTHHHMISGSRSTHIDCLAALRAAGAHILVEHDVDESYSGDGLIAASFLPEDRMIELPPISRNQAHTSLFGGL